MIAVATAGNAATIVAIRIRQTNRSRNDDNALRQAGAERPIRGIGGPNRL